MNKYIRIKKGFDIKLVGDAKPVVASVEQADTFAIKPPDFHGVYLAKAAVREGDNVQAGTPLFFDKRQEQVVHVSPVSGEVVEVIRGAKRKLLAIKILADRKVEHMLYTKYSVSDIAKLKADTIKETLLKAGVWPNIIQRPFGVIADPNIVPKSIHISTFDTHPLAPDYSILFKNQEHFFGIGISLLKKLTSGSIHLNIHIEREISSFFSGIDSVVKNKFSGPHPSGCLGVQIHHINPINKGDVVWTINPFGVIQIGKLFHQGIHDASRIIAVTGSEVKNPQYYKTYTGAEVSKFLQNNLQQDNVRVISGNVLTGTNIGKNGHIGYFDHAITVIPEGDKDDSSLLGWARPITKKLSFHRTLGLFSFLNRKKKFVLNANMNGESRAFVHAGAFEQVVPMDILPTYLLKSIMAKDIDEMEELGIYEVIEEDLALCEFIDVSKHNVQALVREGIELVQTS